MAHPAWWTHLAWQGRRSYLLVGAFQRIRLSVQAGAGLVVCVTVVSLAVAVLLAGAAVRLIETRVTQLMLTQITARAVDQLELGILQRVDAADFLPPHSPAKTAALSARMEPLIARLREEQSGVIRVNIVAADGTIIYSDLLSAR